MDRDDLKTLARGSVAFAREALGGSADEPAVLGAIAGSLLSAALSPDVLVGDKNIVTEVLLLAGKKEK